MTIIEDATFCGCCKLKSISIPESIDAIGKDAFMDCRSLTRITIPPGVKTIGQYAFFRCSNLIYLILYKGIKNIDKNSFLNTSLTTVYYVKGTKNDWKNIDISENQQLLNAEIICVAKENDVSYASIIGLSDLVYTGSPIKPVSSIYLLGQELKANVDYTVSYANNTNVGSAKVTILGKGAYIGEKSVTFDIQPASLSDAIVTGLSDKLYTGKTIIQDPIVKVNDLILNKDIDYTIIFENNTNAGMASVKIKGIGNYAGETLATFRIKPATISKATVLELTEETYTGKAITQFPVVKIGAYVLKINTDYIISYKNNINAGTATITITGKGNYTGTKTVSFEINKAAQSITATDMFLTYLETGMINASGNKGVLTYQSSDSAVATVDSNGKVTAEGAGTATITITAAETDNYNATTKQITVTIAKADQSITAKATASSIAVGKTSTVSTTGNKGKVTYTSSNTAIATVNASTGVVTGKKAGTVTITASAAATANYNAASKTVKITVTASKSLKNPATVTLRNGTIQNTLAAG